MLRPLLLAAAVLLAIGAAVLAGTAILRFPVRRVAASADLPVVE